MSRIERTTPESPTHQNETGCSESPKQPAFHTNIATSRPQNISSWSATLIDRHELQILRPSIIRRWPDQLVIDTLFHHMRRPAAGPGDDEQRGEHCHRHTQHVVADGAEPIQVR